MPQPKLVIFDCDGVLVDSEIVHGEVMSKNFHRYGLDITPQKCLELFAGSKMALNGQTAIDMGANLPENWIDEIYPELFARLRLGVPVIEGVLDTMKWLDSANIPFCVASNGSEEKMEIMLGQSEVYTRLKGNVFSAHTIGIWKPDPGLFLHAANTLGIDPKDCAVVEDSHTGVTAARKAGMTCFGFAPDGNSAHLEKEGAIPFRHMRELPNLLQTAHSSPKG